MSLAIHEDQVFSGLFLIGRSSCSLQTSQLLCVMPLGRNTSSGSNHDLVKARLVSSEIFRVDSNE